MATTLETKKPTVERSGLSAGLIERILSALVIFLVATAVVWGWMTKGGGLLDPEYGFGYALGIIGGSLMIILLAYPLRKRAKKQMKAAGSIGFWFRFHMLLGLLGPLAILYHARFSFGSLNSTVALSAMMIVASSGLVGRFLYSRVHRGYSNRKLELRGLKSDMDNVLAGLEDRGLARQDVLDRLLPFETCAVEAGSAFWTSASAVVGLSLRTRFAERSLLKQISAPTDVADLELRDMIGAFFQAARRAAEFAFYDRLLRLWHLLHLPLFFLLVAAAILHIVAVHMY